MMRYSAPAIIVGLILAAAFLRLVPHPPNFAPVVAMALFAGAVVPDRRWALVVPLVAMALSDLVLGLHPQLWIVYASLAVCVGVGLLMRGRVRPATVAAGTVGGSVAFFVLTNLGVWVGSGIYPLSMEGLTACFVAAIPFFHNALAGDLFYSALLFGGYAAVTRLSPRLRLPASSPG